MVVIETAHISFASSPVHDIKGLSRFVRQSDSILSDESVMANDKCVTKEANKLAEFIYARRNNQKKTETELYINTIFVCLYIFQTYEKRENTYP